jgi:hypothetical protein
VVRMRPGCPSLFLKENSLGCTKSAVGPFFPVNGSEDGELLQRSVPSVIKSYGVWMKSVKMAGKKYSTSAAEIKPMSRLPPTSSTIEEIFERT